VGRIRLVIADRRPVVLQGFAWLLVAEPDFEVVASCLDGASCLEAVRNLTPDVVLVEDGFSDVTASEMLAVANTENLPARFVFYTASVAHGDLAAAIAAGACNAISMREKPETLLQRLRLLAPTPGRAAAGKEQNDAFGEDELTLLTDQERKIMRLVACGMSNKEIARQLKVSTGTIKAHLDRIFAQLEIKNRKELATFTLSRLYGGVGALAALILAALDHVQAANATTLGHAHSDTFTVMAADGTSAVMTITINSKKTAAPGKTAKAGRVANSAVDTPTRASKPIEASADIAASTMTLPTLDPPRPGLSSYGAFMLATVGVWLYELLTDAAHAFNVRDGLSDIFASAAADGTSELVTHNIPGTADAKLDGFDTPAWLNSEIHHESFAFETPRSDAIGRSGDELQVNDGAAGEDSVSGSPHVGSGGIDAPIDHGGFKQAATTDESRSEHDTIQAIAGDGSNPGQSQRDLHASEDGAAAGKPHVEDAPPGHDPDHGQSQRELHASENGAAAGKPAVKDWPPGHDPDHGQSQRELHASADGSSTAERFVRDDVPGSHANSGQSQRDSHEAHPNASGNLHAGGNDQATDDSGQTQKAATPQLGDSFHFRNEVAAAKAPDILEAHIGHGQDTVDHGPHGAGIDGLAPIQDAGPIGPSHAEQSVSDHAKGAEHHPAHDLLV
jgi:VCBS repeat-containing protein